MSGSPLLFYYTWFHKEVITCITGLFLKWVALPLSSVQHDDNTWNISSTNQLISSESQIYRGTVNILIKFHTHDWRMRYLLYWVYLKKSIILVNIKWILKTELNQNKDPCMRIIQYHHRFYPRQLKLLFLFLQ